MSNRPCRAVRVRPTTWMLLCRWCPDYRWFTSLGRIHEAAATHLFVQHGFCEGDCC